MTNRSRNNWLSKQITSVQYDLLLEFLGHGSEASDRADEWHRWSEATGADAPGGFRYPAPKGLERRTIDLYERVADTKIKLDQDSLFAQRDRQKLCEAAIRVLDRTGRTHF